MPGMSRRVVTALAVLLAALPLGCTEPRTDFLTRVAEDCTAGDQAACSLLRAPPSAAAFDGLGDTRSRSRALVQEDLEAMIRGMAQAHAAPRVRPADGAR